MHLSTLGLLSLGAVAVEAFKETSPFFLYSTAELLGSSSQFRSAASLTADISSQLNTCPSTYYVVVSQQEVTAQDFASSKAAPHLSKSVSGNDKSVRSSLSVNEVVGGIETKSLAATLQKNCGTVLVEIDGSSGQFSMLDEDVPTTLLLDFPAPPSDQSRQDQIFENDLFLSSVLEHLPTQDYTVIYTTTSRSAVPVSSPAVYDMEDESIPQQNIHMEMKRDHQGHPRRAAASKPALFERYQYFTPGIFMGLAVVFLLSMILYTAISGLSSLTVTYAAFDKENGPSAQKKQQ